MKKFLVFLVSIVVVVCLGMTTYYFLRNDETINFKTKEVFCNSGDVITLQDLGFERVKAHKKTEIDYNAGGEEVTNFVRYDEEKGYYIVGENGGDVNLVIKTTNKKFAEFKVTVHIGNGSEENPYYIDDETSLAKIGSAYGLDKHYQLKNDVIVSNSFTTIGYNASADTWTGFSGTFNGNGYSISGINISGSSENAGLFSTINNGAVVKNLKIKNSTISGDFTNAGILAGKVLGTVKNVAIDGGTVASTQANAKVGGLAGYIGAVNFETSYAKNVAVSAEGAGSIVGGLFGEINESNIQACYASNAALTASTSSSVGGFAGKFVIGTNSGSILQSYANATSSNTNFAGFIGTIDKTSDFDVNNTSMLKYLVGNIAVSNGTVVKTVNVPNKADSTPFFATFEDTTNGYYLISNYATENDLILETDLTYYEVDPETAGTKVQWDSNVWINADNMLPELTMGTISPASVAGEYVRRNLNKVLVDSLSDLSNASNKELVLTTNLTLPASWTPIDVQNTTINGKGYTITFAGEGNKSLFNNITDSTIKNLNLANVKLTSDSTGALANKVTSTNAQFASSIENVNVTYVADVTSSNNFGGLVAVAEQSIIRNCSVTGLNHTGNSSEVGGLVCSLIKSTLLNSSVSATVSGKLLVGGVVAKNNESTISNVSGSVIVNVNSNVTGESLVGGVAGQNIGLITDTNLNVDINVNSLGGVANIGGVAGVNEAAGSIGNAKLTGNGIKVADLANTINVGGITAKNIGSISLAHCFMNQIGSYNVGRNQTVGGVAAINNTESSKISQVIVSSNIYGNNVAGVVAIMDTSTSASVDQVLVGIFNPETDAVSDNTIQGDKYVAGVAVELSAGSITNVQTSSNIVGGTNSTVSSLVVLVFPDGAVLTNAAINNSFEGNGSFFMETWRLATSTNTDEFGTLENDGRYNVYGYDAHVGSLQSVVINTEKAKSKGVTNITEAEFTGSIIWVRLDYGDTAESSYYKAVSSSDFVNASTYKTNWNARVDSGLFGWGNTDLSREMKFDVGGIWLEGNGIYLAFTTNV